MRPALIPPKGLYGTTVASDIHLCLAQIDDPDYWTHYTRRPETDYLIMDNGAAEGKMVGDEFLLDRADVMKADEVVMPDVMEDAEATIERAHDFMLTYHKWIGGRSDMPQWFKFMGVVQSQGDMGGIMRLDAFKTMPYVTTIGIPRHLVRHDRYFRYQILSHIRGMELDKRFEVHLLGTDPYVPYEISYIQEVHGWTRSVDTSMPYNWTIAGEPLAGGVVGIKRPDGYFEKDHSWVDRELLRENINRYMRWARGTESTRR
jgi:hypothetical protein